MSQADPRGRARVGASVVKVVIKSSRFGPLLRVGWIGKLVE